MDNITLILILYALANISIILYFFIYKPNEADKVYNKRLNAIEANSK